MTRHTPEPDSQQRKNRHEPEQVVHRLDGDVPAGRIFETTFEHKTHPTPKQEKGQNQSQRQDDLVEGRLWNSDVSAQGCDQFVYAFEHVRHGSIIQNASRPP